MNIKEFIRKNSFLNNEELLKRFAEIVIDRCAEEATLSYRQTENKGFTFVATKSSILNVKKELI